MAGVLEPVSVRSQMSVKPAERDAATPGSYLRRGLCTTAPANSAKWVLRLRRP
jgi:hypothetical protein